jgi:hypothetical protein
VLQELDNAELSSGRGKVVFIPMREQKVVREIEQRGIENGKLEVAREK